MTSKTYTPTEIVALGLLESKPKHKSTVVRYINSGVLTGGCITHPSGRKRYYVSENAIEAFNKKVKNS